MRLPFVARSTYDAVVESRDFVGKCYAISELGWAARYEALLLQYTDMAKRQVPDSRDGSRRKER